MQGCRRLLSYVVLEGMRRNWDSVPTILQQQSHVHACMLALQFLYQSTQLLSRGGEKHTTFLHLALFPPYSFN